MRYRMAMKLVLGALFTALICVVTMFVKSPLSVGGAYINAGDAMIYAAGIVMSGPWAAAAAGIGSMLADLIVGSPYLAATLVIKALMGLVVGLALYGRKAGWLRCLLFMGLSSLVMVAGYGAYEFLFLGYAAFIANLVPNLIQAVGGVVIGLFLGQLVRRVVPETWAGIFKKV